MLMIVLLNDACTWATASRICRLAFLRTLTADAGVDIRDSYLLLDAATRTLARACIRSRALPAQRQTAAVPDAAIAAEVHEALDVHRDLAAQIASTGTFAMTSRSRPISASVRSLTCVPG